jgi:uncharacterized membrane protein YoaK (UPF0700 family)
MQIMATIQGTTTIDTHAAALRVRDVLLKALTVSSGAIDAISFLALGKVFTAFMTGNIVFLGLRTAGCAGPSAVAVAAAIASFSVGVYLSTRIAKPSGGSGGSGVWPRGVTVALGVSVVAQAVFMAVWLATGGHPSSGVTDVLLGLWGFAMGMQSAAVRTLHVDAVFTTAATATILFLAGDVTTWSTTAAERRRLAGVLVSLFVGATAGGLLLQHAYIYAPVLPFVITLLVVATAAMALRDGDTAEDRGRR